MITSVVAPVAGATGTASDEGVIEEKFDVSEREHSAVDHRTHDASDVEIDEAVTDAEGTVELVVRVEESDLPLLGAQSDAAAVTGLKEHATESQTPVLEYIDETDGLETKNTFWLTNAVLVEADTSAVDVTGLAAQPGVEAIHENYRFETPEPTSIDTADGGETDVTYGLDQTNATEVWDEYDTRGEGASVAVLDTGVAPDHPDIDIDPANWAEFDGSGDQVDSDPHDTAYHGTHVSGTVVGGNASGTGIGVAPDAELYHGLVLPDGGGSFAQIVAGIEWAVDEDVDVVSMSLGADGYHGDLVEPVRNAYDAGTVVVSSSGNSGAETSGSPANVYETFAVGMSNENYGIDGDSSGEVVDTEEAWGVVAPAEWPDEYVVPDVAAPGVDVLSAIPEGTIADDPDAIYGSLTGTSMAAPHVAGSLALVKSATDEELDVAQSEALFESTAWKPDGEPDEQDIRYGHGLIDTKAAADRLAADSGVEGTVTSDAGEPIADASVTLDGYPAYTDADGTYQVNSAPGEFVLEADAFGYTGTSTDVEVVDGEFATQDLELDRELAVELVDAQPRSVQTGGSFEVTVDAAHLESYQVDIEGYDAADASLTIGGEAADFGEAVEFDEPTTDTVTVEVTTSADTLGDVELVHSFEGMGDSVELATGPTGLFDEPIEVGIVAPEGQTVTTVESFLEESLDIRFQFTTLTLDEAIDEADSGTYDSYVVQSLGTDTDLAEEFVETTKSPELGVVYLQQMGEPTSAIDDLAAATDNPRTVGNYFDVGTGAVNYEIDATHPIFDDVAAEGDTVELYTPEVVGLEGYFHAFFEGYEGHVHSEDLATTSYSGYFLDYETGTGMTVENNSRTVLAASLTPSQLVSSGAFSQDAAMILENSVAFASETPPAYVDGAQDKRIDPGNETTVNVTADQLSQFKVDVVGGTLEEDDLTLYFDGEEAFFGQYRAFEEPTDVDEFEITVAADDDVVGDFELETTLVTVDEHGDSQPTTIETGTTAVYETPLEVPQDVETLAEAVDIVSEDGEIVLDDGEYANSVALDDITDAAYVLDTPGVTIRAADGADPVVTFDGDSGASDRIMEIRANDVTLSDLRINVDEDGNAFDGSRAVQNVGYDGVTVENVTIGGDRVIFFSDAEEFTVRDTELTDTGWSGIQTRIAGQAAGGGLSENVVIDNVTIHEKPEVDLHGAVQITESTDITIANSDIAGQINLDASRDVTVANNTVDAHGLVGVDTFYAGDTHVEGNTVENASIAVNLEGLESAATVVDNTIDESSTGVLVSDIIAAAEITHNEIAAEDGIEFQGTSGTFGVAATDTTVTYNDLSGSDLPFLVDDTEDGAEIDVRHNYVGDDRPVTDGDLVYTPYLTEPPTDEMPPRDELTDIGVDLHLEAGDATAIGVPGPTSQTVSDLFGDSEGVVYGFDADDQSWEQLMHNDEVTALEALVVVVEDDTHVDVQFTSDDAPSGPGQASLSEGWNFVAPPTYGGVDDAFEHATTDVSLVMHTADRPAGQIAPAGELDGIHTGDGDPRVSPFEGYFVFADGEGTLPAYLASDPTTAQLYEDLGAADHLEIDGADAESSADTVADVLASDLEGDDLEQALVAAVSAELREEVDEDASVEAALHEIEDVHAAALDDADGNEALVEDAVRTATRLHLTQAFDVDAPSQADEHDDANTSTALNQPTTAVPAASG